VRLLLVTPEMRTGGAQVQWAALAGALVRRGLEVELLALAEQGELYGGLRSAGVRARCAGMRRAGDLAALRRALSAADPPPDVIVSRGVSGQLVGAQIARRARAPHVVNEHTPCLPNGGLLPPRPHQRVLTRLVAPRVDRVIAVTTAQVEPLARRGYRRDRIEVVANGVFEAEACPQRARAEVRAKLELGDADFALLLPAALRPEKRADAFVRAVTAAHRANPAIRGLVAGDGPEAELVRREAGDGAVRLLGARADVPDLMAAADGVCLTSEAEALPMALLEAMALARPVVATRVGGTPEAVLHGETGLLVEPGDEPGLAAALVELAADRERARRLGLAGRERQRERFDGEAMVDGYLAVLRRVVG
jgi:glycosyltransferase involved in cell wall biosynthesis